MSLKTIFLYVTTAAVGPAWGAILGGAVSFGSFLAALRLFKGQRALPE